MQFYAIVKETFIFRLKNKNKSKHEFVVELLPRNIIKKVYVILRALFIFPIKNNPFQIMHSTFTVHSKEEEVWYHPRHNNTGRVHIFIDCKYLLKIWKI